MIDVLERAINRRYAGIVRIVVALEVIVRAGERRPGPRSVSGVKSVMLKLAGCDRGEDIVGVQKLDRAVDLQVVRRLQSDAEGAAVLVDGDVGDTGQVSRGVRGTFADDVLLVVIGEREQDAIRKVVCRCEVVRDELLAEEIKQRRRDARTAFKRRSWLARGRVDRSVDHRGG